MYKSAHDIPVYNFTQCELGNLSYLGGWGLLRSRRFEKIKAELSTRNKPDPAQIDASIKMNWISTMELLDRAVRASAFGTPEQQERILAVAGKLGMTLDPDKNKDILKAYVDWVNSTLQTVEAVEEKGGGEELKKSPLRLLTGHSTFISIMLNLGRLDPKTVSVVEFLELSEMAKDKAEREKGGFNVG